eukprot:tig00001007_g6243.t1
MDAEAASLTRFLPNELVSAVLSFLEVGHRSVASAVCVRWKRCAGEAPFSPSASLTVAVDVEEGDPRPELERRRREGRLYKPLGPRAAELEPRALSAAAAAAVLRSPACRTLHTLRLTVLYATEPSASSAGADGDGCETDALSALLAAAPSLRRLELSAPCETARALRAAASRLRLADSLPSLRELFLTAEGGALCPFDSEGPPPAHPALEVLGAHAALPRAEDARGTLLERLPSLRRVHSLRTESPGALSALARAGVRARCLSAVDADLSEPAAAADLAAVLRPSAFAPEAEPSRLYLCSCALPEAGEAPSFDGLESVYVACCTIREGTLRWLLGGAHAATLGRFTLKADLVDVGPACLGETLAALRPAARVSVGWPASWGAGRLEEARRALGPRGLEFDCLPPRGPSRYFSVSSPERPKRPAAGHSRDAAASDRVVNVAAVAGAEAGAGSGLPDDIASQLVAPPPLPFEKLDLVF